MRPTHASSISFNCVGGLRIKAVRGNSRTCTEGLQLGHDNLRMHTSAKAAVRGSKGILPAYQIGELLNSVRDQVQLFDDAGRMQLGKYRAHRCNLRRI